MLDFLAICLVCIASQSYLMYLCIHTGGEITLLAYWVIAEVCVHQLLVESLWGISSALTYGHTVYNNNFNLHEITACVWCVHAKVCFVL